MKWTPSVRTTTGVVISLLALWIIPSEQNHYCSINRDHTLCKYQGVGPKCKTPMELGITSRERQQIMHLHNSLRQMIANGGERRGRGGSQPQATNMRQMEWDDELARSAQRLAEQCKYAHDCLNCRKVDRFLTGQNLYQFSENILRDGSNWEQAIMAWYDEVAAFNPKHVDHFEFIRELGHYTQMAWADTWKIGCGYVYYKDGKWNRKLYVCNYGPAGNIITTQMYKRGSPCSDCPEGTSCSNQYPGLCSAGGRGSFQPAPRQTPAPPPPTAPPTPRSTTPRRTTTTTTTTTTTPRPTTQRTFPTTQRTFPTTQRTFPTTQRTFPTTSRRTYKPRVTTPTPKIIFNELDSNELTLNDNFSPNSPDLINQGQGFNSKKKTITSKPHESRNRFQFKSTTTSTTQTTPTQKPSKTSSSRFTFSRFIASSRTTTTSTTTTTTTTPSTTTLRTAQTTPRRTSVNFSPRIDQEQRKTRKIDAPRRFTNSGVQQKGSTKPADIKIIRIDESPLVFIRDRRDVLTFCDFDRSKCPVRSMGFEGWNYTAFETPGFGHGFSSIVRPGADSFLQIRSDSTPSTDKDGSTCLRFRFVNYVFGVDGGYAKSDGMNPDTRKPVFFTVTVHPLSDELGVESTPIEIPDKSKYAYDWLTGIVQIRNSFQNQFLISFKVPKNPLTEDNQYLAIDDVVVSQGTCRV